MMVPQVLLVLSALLSADSEAMVGQTWETECTVDEITDVRTCRLHSRFTFFGVYFSDSNGPYVTTGNDYPGRNPTVRVDQNKAITFDEAKDLKKQATIIGQCLRGAIVRFEWNRFPNGPERETVSLGGFKDAYAELLREMRQTRER